MENRKVVIGAFAGVMLICLIISVVYLGIDYNTVAEATYAGTIEYVADVAAPPVSYKSKFAKWEYTVSDDGTEYSTLQLLQPIVQVGNFGMVIADGSQGRHVSNPTSVMALSDDTPTKVNIKYYYDAMSKSTLSPLKEFNAANLTIGLYANLDSEGKPMMWENRPEYWTAIGVKDVTLANGDIVRKVKNNDTYVEIGTKKVGYNHFYISTKTQLDNLVALGESHALYETSLGIGSPQWSGPRCWRFISYAAKEYGKSWTFSDDNAIKDMETDYLLKELNKYIDDFYNATSYYELSVEQCTGFIAAKFECPQASAAYHKSKSERFTINYYKEGSTDLYTLLSPSGSDFYDGTVTDFSVKYYWEGTTTEVAEAYRIRKAIDMYDELFAK